MTFHLHEKRAEHPIEKKTIGLTETTYKLQEGSTMI
jgi:hypothetical protein